MAHQWREESRFTLDTICSIPFLFPQKNHLSVSGEKIGSSKIQGAKIVGARGWEKYSTSTNNMKREDRKNERE